MDDSLVGSWDNSVRVPKQITGDAIWIYLYLFPKLKKLSMFYRTNCAGYAIQLLNYPQKTKFCLRKTVERIKYCFEFRYIDVSRRVSSVRNGADVLTKQNTGNKRR